MPSERAWLAGFLRHQRLCESIASVALSHPTACNCRICKAADGDEAAYAVLLELIGMEETRDA